MHDRVAGFLKFKEAVGTEASSVGSVHLVVSWNDRDLKLLLQGQIPGAPKPILRPMKVLMKLSLEMGRKFLFWRRDSDLDKTERRQINAHIHLPNSTSLVCLGQDSGKYSANTSPFPLPRSHNFTVINECTKLFTCGTWQSQAIHHDGRFHYGTAAGSPPGARLHASIVHSRQLLSHPR